jgi:phosphoribosylformylglycinamidine synthase
LSGGARFPGESSHADQGWGGCQGQYLNLREEQNLLEFLELAWFTLEEGFLSIWGLLVIHKYQARIYVTLRPSVLDPAGVAVESGLKQLGYEGVEQVRIGKYIELMLCAANEDKAREQLDQICDQLLANPVIENYRFDLIEVAAIIGASS